MGKPAFDSLSYAGPSHGALNGSPGEFTLPEIEARRLMINDTDQFILRGFAYSPTPICQYPGGEPFDTYTDPRLPKRDAPWIRYAGGNVVRIYGALFTDGSDTWEIGTTRAYLRELEKRDIWVVMGTEIQPSECLDDGCEDIVRAHVDLVRAFRGVPNILMWAPGNEVNSHVTYAQVGAWYDLLNDIAAAIKTEQGGVGPGIGPYVCGVLGEFDGKPDDLHPPTPALHDLDTRAPNIDVWAINTWRGSSLDSLFVEVLDATTKPFWIAEMGIDRWHHDEGEPGGGHEDEVSQANYLKALWAQIEKHCNDQPSDTPECGQDNAVFGADIAFYSDEWWKCPPESDDCPADATPCAHDIGGGNPFACGPDDWMDEEWLGVMEISPNPGEEIDSVTPQRGYYAAKKAWRDTTPKPPRPVPVLADFNAPDCEDALSNNYAGTLFGHYSAGTGGRAVSNQFHFGSTTGLSQCDECDKALRATGRFTSGGPDTLVIVVVTLYPRVDGHLVARDSCLTAFNRIAFQTKRGSTTSLAVWRVHLENKDNVRVWSSPAFEVSESFTHFAWNIDAELGPVAQIAFQAAIPDGSRTDTELELDLILDNLAVFSDEFDEDGDDLPDAIDNCPELANPHQEDGDCDGVADVCEAALEIIASWPPTCAIDTRAPSNIDCSQPYGWDSVGLTFNKDVGAVDASEFAVTVCPDDTAPPEIIHTKHVACDTVVVDFNERIPLEHWTCVQHVPGGTQACIGYLPGDVNQDRLVATGDINWLIDCLNGVRSCEIWECDIDRSGICMPQDILRLIDLLNGAGCYEPWIARSIPCDCPAPE